MRKKGKEKRHIRLYFLVVFVLLGVIVVLGTRNREYIPNIKSPKANLLYELRSFESVTTSKVELVVN